MNELVGGVCVFLKDNAFGLCLEFPYSPASICLFKVIIRKIKTKSEICSKSTIKTPERCHSGVFIVNLEQISHVDLVFPLLTLNKETNLGKH